VLKNIVLTKISCQKYDRFTILESFLTHDTLDQVRLFQIAKKTLLAITIVENMMNAPQAIFAI